MIPSQEDTAPRPPPAPPSEPLAATTLPSTGEPPAVVSDEIAKKLSIARGEGYRRERPTTESASGDHITLRGGNGAPIPCKYCGVNPCRGMNWFFEGQSRFKCDACGKKQSLGVQRDVADRTAAELEGMDRAEANRHRAWREDDARREEERKNQMENIMQSPDTRSAFFS